MGKIIIMRNLMISNRIANVGYAGKKIKRLITSQTNAANYRSARIGMTGWEH